MGFIFGKNGNKKFDEDRNLLATCYRCGHKHKIRDMREVGLNVFLCESCRTKAIEKKGGK